MLSNLLKVTPCLTGLSTARSLRLALCRRAT